MTKKTHAVGPRTRVKQHPDIASRTIDGQEVVVVPETRKLQILNEVATRVWALCDGRSVEEIAAIIVDEYDVQEDEARADVLELVTDMLERGMVELA